MAAVDAPDGRGNEEADTGCVTALPSTFNAVIDAILMLQNWCEQNRVAYWVPSPPCRW